jgi:hypothetical protein
MYYFLLTNNYSYIYLLTSCIVMVFFQKTFIMDLTIFFTMAHQFIIMNLNLMEILICAKKFSPI